MAFDSAERRRIRQLNNEQGEALALWIDPLVNNRGLLYHDLLASENTGAEALAREGLWFMEGYLYPSLRIRGEYEGLVISYVAVEKLEDEKDEGGIALRVGVEEGAMESRSGNEPWARDPHIHNVRVVFGFFKGSLQYRMTEDFRQGKNGGNKEWREMASEETSLILMALNEAFDRLT